MSVSLGMDFGISCGCDRTCLDDDLVGGLYRLCENSRNSEHLRNRKHDLARDGDR